MLPYSVPREFEIGDEVALTGTVTTILPSGRAKVSIPSYDPPYSVDPPPKTRAGDRVVLVWDIIRIDREADKLTVRIHCGGVITVGCSAVTRLRKHRRHHRADARRIPRRVRSAVRGASFTIWVHQSVAYQLRKRAAYSLARL